MPKFHPGRSVTSEQDLARRIGYERERKGMTYDALAYRMTQEAGCPLDQSAIYKIEKGKPPRRITVDELVGFSRVFQIPVSEMLLPPEAVLTTEITSLFEEWVARWAEAERLLTEVGLATSRQQEAFSRLVACVEQAGPGATEAKQYFVKLMNESPLRTTPAERKALEEAEREAEQAMRNAEAALKKSEKRRG